MGRRKQNPAEQEAKGFPGRRKGQTKAEAKRLAAGDPEEAMLATYDVDGLRPPRRFLTEKGAAALAAWNRLAPRLRATSRASAEFGDLLAAYCDSVALYQAATMDIDRLGLVVETPMTDSDKTMLRRNPAVNIREKALAEMMALSARFGFTPLDNFDLLKAHRQVIETASFGRQGALPLGGQAGPLSTPDASPLAGMDAMDSPPPGARPN